MAERRPLAGPLLSRARSQWRLLAAALVVMVLGGASAGTGALLVATGGWHGLEAAAEQLDGDPDGADLVTVLAGIGGASATPPPHASLLLDAVLPAARDAVAPFRAEISVWLASPRLRLPGDQVRHTYLLDADTAAEHATLVAGRWPRVADGVTEVAVPTIVASALGVGPGDRLELGATDGVDPAATVEVVGLVDLASSPTWARDPLGGEGVDDGDRVPVLGPLLTVPGALSTTDATVGRLAVEVDVDPTGRPDAIADLAARVGGLSRAAQAQLGDGSVDYLTARSGLGRFAADARTELARTAGLVLAVVLLVLVLAGAALALVVRATAGARATEVALLGDRGAGRVRLAAWAAVENLGLGALAAALAVPLAAAGYRGLTAVAPLADAWRGSSLQVRGADQVLVVTVLAAVLVQVGVATVVAARAAEPGPGRLDGGVARSGVDVLLAAVGVLAFVQLRSHRPVPGSLDPVLVLAPALCVLAVAVLALRVVPVLVRLGEQVARRSTGVVLPLAGWHVARGRAATGMLLTVLATASGTLALATQATWDDAQRLQAAARLAADVRVPADGSAGQGSAILEAARQLDTSALVVPVTDRKVGLGSRPGGAALVALDTRTGAAAIDAPLAGGWAERVAPLAPEVAADPLVVGGAPFDVVVDVTTTGGMDGLTVTPTLVVQDELGRADAVALAPVGADRQATRRVPVEGTPALAGRWRVVAVHLAVTAPTTEPTAPTTELTVAVQVAGATRGSGTWTGTGDGILVLGTPRVTGGGDRLVTRAEISLLGLSYAGATVLVTAFPTREELPVLASATLADELALAPGDTIDLSTGQAVVTAVVAGTVPYVPGRPGEAAVLADSEALTRSLLVDGELEPATDAWWVASDDPVALATAVGGRSSVELGDRLAAGPLRAAAVAALTMLALVAVLLAVAGAFARERAAAPERALEAARLRGLGASRRSVLAATLARHALVTVVAVALGALVGGALASFLAPVLVGSGDAGPVVPAPVPVWPWPQEAALLVTLLSGALVAGVPTARRVASRSTAVVLRSGGAS